MVSVCTVPASRGGRLCEHFGGYKNINRIPLPLTSVTCCRVLVLQFPPSTINKNSLLSKPHHNGRTDDTLGESKFL